VLFFEVVEGLVLEVLEVLDVVEVVEVLEVRDRDLINWFSK